MPEDHKDAFAHGVVGGSFDTPSDKTSVYPEPTKGFAAPLPDFMKPEPPKTRDATPVQFSSSDGNPVPVVKVLSLRGVEYLMMSFTLWIASGALIWTLLSIVNGHSSASLLAMPIALLLVCVPTFGFFFLRLKNQEVTNPELRYEPSKRRLTQITQFLAFITCLFNIVAFVYLIITKVGGSESVSLGKSFLNLIIILIIAGGVLAYYWNDEHRMNRG